MSSAPRFDAETLRQLAGDRVFARGQDYATRGQVTLLLVEPARVLATVQGEERYRVELRGHGRTLEGDCTCRAWADFGFCKHCVATALAANASGEHAAASGPLPMIRSYLAAQPVESLVEMLVEQAIQDDALFVRLRAVAALRADPALAAEHIRAAIERATTAEYYYEGAGDWNGEVSAALDGIAELIAAGQGAAALQLASLAIDNLEASLESVDDESGVSVGQVERARELHREAALLARPDPIELAEELYGWEVAGGLADFYESAAVYAEVLGEAGLAEFRRLAEADWASIPRREPPKPGQRVALEFDARADAILRILDGFAEREGNIEARIALRRKNLSTPDRYLELARFCLEQGRTDEALRLAEEGLWLFEDGRPEPQLVTFLAERLAAAGRGAEAERPLWQAFERSPSRRLYDLLAGAGGPPLAQRAQALLAERAVADRSQAWNGPATLFVGILKDQGRLAEAWALVRAGGVSWHLRQELIAESGKAFPEDAAAVLTQDIEGLIASAAYPQAVALIATLASLRDAPAQAAYLADLRLRHARKRKLMGLLP